MRTDADQGHLQGPRDRSGGQRQHIHVVFQLFDLFLMRNTEALLFIDDQQAQVFELHILGKDTMGSDHHIHLAFPQAFDGLFLLGRSPETA